MSSYKNPYPGLRPFQPEESHLFFGRERYIETILQKLHTYHFVSIVGNSGSGKSSLLKAGVIPKLLAGKEWIVTTMRPGKSPVEELLHALLVSGELLLNPIDNHNHLQILGKSDLGLVQLLRGCIPDEKKLLIVVDQFEELFRYNKNNEEMALRFVNLLLSAINQSDVKIHLIITLRSDFIGECEQFIGLPEAINSGQFLIPRMKREELQLSITGPAEYNGQRISPRLVQQLLKDVGTNPDQLPILQHVLMRTWEVWNELNDPGLPIDIEHYEQTGKMDKALSNHAEEAMLEVRDEESLKKVASIFKTLTVKESDSRGVRRPTTVSKIAQIASCDSAEIIRLIDIFRSADRGFLMPPASTPIHESSVIDISHESLMRVWERCSVWLDEEYESSQLYQRITESALLYEKGLSGLWRDPDLQIATEWQQKHHVNKPWAEQYNNHFELAIRFIEASELNKRYQDAEKIRRRKVTNLITVVVVMALSALSVWAFFERNHAYQNEQLALQEKQRAQEQELIARNQKKIAEHSATKAEQEKLNAERQKQLAIAKELEANQQKQNAMEASLNAYRAKTVAESEKKMAIAQKLAADSLRKVATLSEKNAYRLRILSIAQTLAIKSTSMQKGSDDDALKSLLALQSYSFNKRYGGSYFNQEVYQALYASYKQLYQEGVYQHSAHTDMVRSVCYSPDDSRIASGGSDGLLMICDARQLNKSIKVFQKQSTILENVQYHSSGKTIACMADKTDLLLFDTEGSTQPSKMYKQIHTDKLVGFVWHGDVLVSAALDLSLKGTHAFTGKEIFSVQLPNRPSCLSFHQPSNKLYVGCENGVVLEVLLSQKPVIKTIQNAESKITAIAVSKDGNQLALGLNDGKMKVNYLKERTELLLNRHKSTITALSFHPSGQLLVSSALDGLVMLWSVAQPDREPIVFKDHESWVWCSKFNHTGNQFCSAGRDKNVLTYFVSEDALADQVKQKLSRPFTEKEWRFYIGNDIQYESLSERK